MKKLKIFYSLVIAAALISSTCAVPLRLSASLIKTSDKSVDSRYQDIDVKGVKPVISGLSNAAFQAQINEQIDAQYNGFIKKSTTSTKKITFSYKTVDSGKYFSILFYCVINDAVSAQNYVSSTVIDVTNEKIVYLNDVVGPNGVKLINKGFATSIAASPSRYNPNFTGIDENRNFYVEGETVHILFDELEMLVGTVGIVEFTFQIGEIKNVVIEKSEYKTKEGYGIKMVPVRQIAEAFGYTVIWNPTTSSADILLNKTPVTSIKIGSNSYSAESGTRRELESAPIIYDGRTYVPVSFFEEILSVSYSISPGGQITFSKRA